MLQVNLGTSEFYLHHIPHMPCLQSCTTDFHKSAAVSAVLKQRACSHDRLFIQCLPSNWNKLQNTCETDTTSKLSARELNLNQSAWEGSSLITLYVLGTVTGEEAERRIPHSSVCIHIHISTEKHTVRPKSEKPECTILLMLLIDSFHTMLCLVRLK